MAKKQSNKQPAAEGSPFPPNMAKEMAKVGIGLEQQNKAYGAMIKSGYEMNRIHKEANENVERLNKAYTSTNRIMREAIQSSNKFLFNQINENKQVRELGNARLAITKILAKQEGQIGYSAVAQEAANALLERELDLLHDQAEVYGYTGDMAAYVAKQLEKGYTIEKIRGQQQFKDLAAYEKSIEFRKKHLELEKAISERAEEVLHHHEHIKDKIKLELGFAKEMAKDPKLLGAFAAEQLAHHIGHANHKMHELVETGMQAGEAIHVMRDNISIMGMLGLSKVAGVNNELIAQYGTINALSEEQRHTVGEMATKMGLAEKEALDLTMAISRMPGESQETAAHFKETAIQVGKTSGILPSQIMKDMAKNSGLMATYSKGGAEGFAKAAAASKKMGVELSSVLNAAEKTLDFESSINSQMEASLLIGKNLNFDKMRAAALSGDANAIMEEQTAIMQQIGSLDEMNVLQKKALADAMGMTVEEMVKMNEAQEMQNRYFGENASTLDNVIGGVMKYGGAALGFVADNGLMIATMAQTVMQFFTMQALRAKDTASITANTAATRLNATQMTFYRNQRALGIPAEQALAAARAQSTAGTVKDTGAENLSFGARLRSRNAALLATIQERARTMGKWLGITATTAETGAETTNEVVKKRGLLSTIAMTIATGARNAVLLVSNGILMVGAGLMSLFGGATATAGAAAGTSAPLFGAMSAGLTTLIAAYPVIPVLLGIGAAFLMIGAGIGLAAYGISFIVEAFAKMPFENLVALPFSLMGIGAGLQMMALAGMGAIPVLGMLITLAAVAPTLTGLATALMGGGGSTGGGGESPELTALKDIKTELAKPIIVKLDGNKVGEGIRQATATSITK